jgi:glycerophosphoryl diester phosphodiesterase
MRAPISLAVLAALLLTAAPASAKTVFGGIHAHRGGALSGGSPSGFENTLLAFEESNEQGADVIELDVKLTSDNVPVVMHDATLDRTTNCTGQVRQKTAAELEAECGVDVRGTGDKTEPSPTRLSVPPLSEVLTWANSNRVKLNLEIKNQPTDPDYDTTSAFADTVLAAVEASGIPKDQVLIQSFWPPNLDRAEARGFTTSILVLSQVATVDNLRLAEPYDIVSPGWPVQGDAKAYVDAAHKAGKPVVPYTLDTKADIQDALDAGVDGVITNDTDLGLKTLYGPACKSAEAQEKRALAKYRAAQKKVKQAKTADGKRKARERARVYLKRYQKIKRSRAAVCLKGG